MREIAITTVTTINHIDTIPISSDVLNVLRNQITLYSILRRLEMVLNIIYQYQLPLLRLRLWFKLILCLNFRSNVLYFFPVINVCVLLFFLHLSCNIFCRHTLLCFFLLLFRLYLERTQNYSLTNLNSFPMVI